MIGVGVHIYIYIHDMYMYIYRYICLLGIYVCGQKKLNSTVAIDSPFQTFAVGLLVEFVD